MYDKENMKGQGSSDDNIGEAGQNSIFVNGKDIEIEV